MKTALTKQEMMDYLADIIELEKTIYGLKMAIDECNRQIAEYSNPLPARIPYPKKVEFEDPVQPKSTAETVNRSKTIARVALVIHIILFFVSISGLHSLLFWLNALIGLPAVLIMRYNWKYDERKHEADWSVYYSNRRNIEKERKEEEARFEREAKKAEETNNRIGLLERTNPVKTQTVKENRELLFHQLFLETETLKKFYQLGYIYPKYQNYACVCSLYEYFASGRCDSLSGTGGAYNLLEQEITMNQVILRLDKIITQLDEIKANQYTLYCSVNEGNRIASMLVDGINGLSNQAVEINSHLSGIATGQAEMQSQMQAQMEELQKTSVIAAFASERAAKEMEYANRMAYFRGDFDEIDLMDPLGKIPPHVTP